MLLYIIIFLASFDGIYSSVIKQEDCGQDSLLVIHKDYGAICSDNNNDDTLNQAFEHMMKRNKRYEFVVYPNIEETEEYFCKVNNTQFSYVTPRSNVVTSHGWSAGNVTIPLTCFTPEMGEGYWYDVQLWKYNATNNTTTRLQILGSFISSEWDTFINHAAFPRNFSFAGARGDQYIGSTAMYWGNLLSASCETCTTTYPQSEMFNPGQGINECTPVLPGGYCAYSANSSNYNCTTSGGNYESESTCFVPDDSVPDDSAEFIYGTVTFVGTTTVDNSRSRSFQFIPRVSGNTTCAKLFQGADVTGISVRAIGSAFSCKGSQTHNEWVSGHNLEFRDYEAYYVEFADKTTKNNLTVGFNFK